MDKSELTQCMMHLKTELRSWQSKAETNENKAERKAQIKAIELEIEVIVKARENLAKSRAELSIVGGGLDSTISTREEYRTEERAIETALKEVPIFGPSHELAPFLLAVKNVYANVENKGVAHVERFFVRTVASRMDQQYQTQMTQYRETNTVDTYQSWEKFMKDTFEPKRSVHQLMDPLDQLSRENGQSYADFGAKVSQEMFRVKTAVVAKFEAQVNKGATTSRKMSVDDMWNLLAARIVLNQMKSDKDMYNMLVPNMDSILKVEDVVNLARTFDDRRVREDKLLAGPSVNVAQKPNNSRKVCFRFRNKGSCSKTGCQYLHSLEKPGSQSEQGTKKDTRDSGSNNRGRGRGRGRGGHSHSGRGGHRAGGGGQPGAHVARVDDDDLNEEYETMSQTSGFRLGSE